MAQAVRLLPTPYTLHHTPCTFLLPFKGRSGGALPYTVHPTPYTFLLPSMGRSGGASDIKPKDYPIITEGLPKDKTPICTIRGFYYIYTMYIYTFCRYFIV